MVPALEFVNISKTYRRRLRRTGVAALSEASFAVEQGEVCALLGPNGAGKTTAIHLLMGFVQPDSGEIRVLGLPAGNVDVKRRIGFVPEGLAFYKNLTAANLLAFHVKLCGASSVDSSQIASLLTGVGLSEHADRHIGGYSRGMMQRLGIVQALLGDPQLLVLDEPTSGLDPSERERVLELLASLRIRGVTVFLSSHIISEVEQIADRAVIIRRGRVVAAGRLPEMLESCNHVEFVVAHLPAEIQSAALARGATIDHVREGTRMVLDRAHKQDLATMLVAAQVDIVCMNPVRDSLQDLFTRLVSSPVAA